MTLTVFLDFDGCLHPNRVRMAADDTLTLEGPGSLFMHAEALAGVLAPFEVDVVLSTSWVPAYGLATARRALPKSLASRVVGSTYQSQRSTRWHQLTRYAQVEAHARRYGLEKWLAIDDDTYGWPAGERKRLINPMPHNGLCAADLEQLVELLADLSTRCAA